MYFEVQKSERKKECNFWNIKLILLMLRKGNPGNSPDPDCQGHETPSLSRKHQC